MAIQFFSAKQFGKPLKVTIQKTGRMGFTAPTAMALNLNENTYFCFGRDESISADLIMIKKNEADEDAFRTIRSGQYYYLAAAALFDLLGYNYKKEPIIFDVKREASIDAEAGGEVYLLTRRAPKSRKAARKEETERSLFE